MSASVAPASTTQTRIAPLYVTKSGNNQSESTKTSPSNQSADPRSAKTVSPQQGDAILSLASTDGSKASSANDKSGRSSVPAANQAYHETATIHTLSDMEDDPLYRDKVRGEREGGGGSSGGGGTDVNLPPVTGETGGSSSGPGGASPTTGTAGGGGGSAPTEGSGGTSGGGGVVPNPNADPHTRVTFQEATETSYATAFDENPRGHKIGNETVGAVAIGENSGDGPDGSIWSTGQILFKNEKGIFFAKPSVPGDVVIARFINGELDITSATPT